MIILDTNVLSALMQRQPESAVVQWLNNQAGDSVWLTTITIFEVRFGLALLSRGRRRDALETAVERLVADELKHRVLDFDTSAAEAAARLAASRQSVGRPVDFRDTQIAGIALSRKATLATRNERHFADLDIRIVNPWSAAEPAKRSSV